MLEEFITSALIIDDKIEEVDALIKCLEDKDIWIKHYTPDDLDSINKKFNNRKLIFLDLALFEQSSTIDNIAKIRQYFRKFIGKNFGSYGIVLWTKHTSHYSDFCEKIYKDGDIYQLPLFIVSLDKIKHLSNNYENVLSDLEEILLNNVTSAFFIEWNNAVNGGADGTISQLFRLFRDKKSMDEYIESVLYKLAINYSGLPQYNKNNDFDLQKDLIKSLMDTLQLNIVNKYRKVDSLFLDDKKTNKLQDKNIKSEIYSQLNSILLLDFQNISQDTPIPGNIYEITDNSTQLFINNIRFGKNQIKIENDPLFKDKNVKRICIEITPPCDFAQEKKNNFSRIIGGIMFDYEIFKNDYKNDSLYTELCPIKINGCEKSQIIIFDFYRFQTIEENLLKDPTKYPILMKAKDKLFADILQKLSSHTARLGIAKIYL